MVTTPKTAHHIVVAEDNLADVVLVKLALENSGLNFELLVLDDGDKALAHINAVEEDQSADSPDLFLLDMSLPKRDGDEILKRLRSSRKCSETPVVIMTSSDAPVNRAMAQSDSATHFFRKPSTLAEFMQLGLIARQLLSPPYPSVPMPQTRAVGK